MATRALTLGALLLVSVGVAADVGGGAGRAAVLEDLHVSGIIEGDVVVFGADLELEDGAEIGGDAIAVGGSVSVSSGAAVDGHVVAVFGSTAVAPAAEIGGRVLAYASLATLASGAGGEGPALSENIPMRLLASGGWLLVTTGLAFLFPVRFRCASWAASHLGARVPALGLLLGVTLMASVLAGLGLGPVLGVPLVASLMVIAFVLKVVGLTVVGCWLGERVLRRWAPSSLPITVEVFSGMMVLLGLRFVPGIGALVWLGVSLSALGASVAIAGVSLDASRAEA